MGGGEYHSLQDDDASVRDAQALFLNAVARLYPKLLENLRDEVLPGKISLTAWAERFRINEPWVIEAARANLDVWREYPETVEILEYFCLDGGGGWEGLRWQDRAFTFGCAAWLPLYETRQAFVTRARQAFERDLAAYVEETKGLAQSHGLEKSPEKRSLQHFDWLVHYQVGGKNFGEIAGQAYIGKAGFRTETRINVMVRIKELAGVLKLDLRQPEPVGRPRN